MEGRCAALIELGAHAVAVAKLEPTCSSIRCASTSMTDFFDRLGFRKPIQEIGPLLLR
jgi:hypothetical protein